MVITFMLMDEFYSIPFFQARYDDCAWFFCELHRIICSFICINMPTLFEESGFYKVIVVIIGLLFIVSSLQLILTKNSIHAIMSLMFLFLLLTFTSILHDMEFLALIFVIIYIGAVCILMLFHIKLLKLFVHRFERFNFKTMILPFFSISILFPCFALYNIHKFSLDFLDEMNVIPVNNILYYLINEKEVISDFFINEELNIKSIIKIDMFLDNINSLNSLETLGFILYTIFFMLLIYGSLILLIAMIGSIYLTLTKKKKKFQYVRKQIFTKLHTKFK